MTNIYEEAKKIMQPEQIDHHESDLYIMATKESRELVNNYEFKSNVTTFVSAIAPHVLWYDIPFAYTPWYDINTRWPKYHAILTDRRKNEH